MTGWKSRELETFRAKHGVRSRDENIEATKASADRLSRKLDAMTDAWADAGGVCCPGCMFGSEYTAVAAKLERVLAWLKVLLLRRGRDEDVKLTQAIEMEAWP